MQIPPVSHPCWTRLASGQHTKLQTKQLGLQLLFKRIQDPKMDLTTKAAEIHKFFEKYAVILDSELSQLERL